MDLGGALVSAGTQIVVQFEQSGPTDRSPSNNGGTIVLLVWTASRTWDNAQRSSVPDDARAHSLGSHPAHRQAHGPSLWRGVRDWSAHHFDIEVDGRRIRLRVHSRL